MGEDTIKLHERRRVAREVGPGAAVCIAYVGLPTVVFLEPENVIGDLHLQELIF